MAKILIVEDEPELALLLKDYILAAQLECEIIGDGLEAWQWLQTNTADLILLDLMLPGLDGLSLCKKIRQKTNVPIIITTAKAEEIDRLLGLEIGADDYICKPFSPREVVARSKAVLRRTMGTEPQSSSQITINADKLCVQIHDVRIELTTVEIRLFELLFHEPGKIFSRQFIMDHIYSDYRVVSDRTVDSHVKKLRKKLSEAAPELSLIHSIYGAGYKFEHQTL